MIKSTEDKFNPVNSTTLFGSKDHFIALTKLYDNKRFPKVILLTGEKGSGKFTLAFHLINFFLQTKAKSLTI